MPETVGEPGGEAVQSSLIGLGQGQRRLERELRAVRWSLSEIQELLRQKRPEPGHPVRTQERVKFERDDTGSVSAFLGEASASLRSVRSGDPVERLSMASQPMCRSGPDLAVPVSPPPGLPPGWPACLESRHDVQDWQWRGEDEDGADPSRNTKDRLRAWSTSFDVEESRSRLTWDPGSSGAMALGGLTLLVLCHDAFMVPWALAWEVEPSGVRLALTAGSCAFWTLDLLLGFFMGYHNGQGTELRLRYTARHHAKTWFVPDLCVVVVDWLSIVPLLSSTSLLPSKNFSRLLRIAKAGKVARILGLMRMMKLAKYFEDYIESGLFSDSSRLALRLLQFLAAVVWMTHIVTCIWFRIGLLQGDTGMNWVHTVFSQETPQGVVEVGFMELGLWHQYLTAFHWAIAQVSLGSTEIICHNSTERFFTCVCILLAFLGGSTLVSSLSATMVDYQAVHRQRKEMLAKLRRFLRENRGKVSKGTALLVQQQASERLRLTDRLQEHEVQVLELLSANVRKELRFEIFQEMLSRHGLLQLWSLLDRSALQRVCLEVFEYKHYQPLDEVFSAGTRTDRAYHLGRGRLVYSKEPETAPVHFREALPVQEGSWLAEAALWSCWLHVGTATAETACEILQVPAQAVAMMMQQRPETRRVTAQYAARFHAQVLAARPPEKSFPDDLAVPETHFEELMTSLQPGLQMQVSLRVISQAGAGPQRKLRQDVKNGGSCVVMQPDGSMERATCWVVLRLQDSRRRLLLRIGRPSAHCAWQPCLELPKKQIEQGELGKGTLDRLMQSLGLREKYVVRVGMERNVEQGHSPEFGVPTRVVQRVHQMFLRDSANLDLAHMHVEQPFAFKNTSRSIFSVNTADSTCLSEQLTDFYCDHQHQSLYAWLTPGVYERLQTPAGERELGRWLSTIDTEDVADGLFEAVKFTDVPDSTTTDSSPVRGQNSSVIAL